MESLLSVSFDNISSRDGSKIRKGLRQIEGLLAQICLSPPTAATAAAAAAVPSSPQKKRKSTAPAPSSSPKNLRELNGDPAFREFFRLQDGFQWNVASRLVSAIERLLGMGTAPQTDALIQSALDLLHGVLVLHPSSRSLFERETTMELLLDLLDASSPSATQARALLVLVAALLGWPRNARVFEAAGGIAVVASLSRARTTARDVRMRTLEFLYFYLLPEGGGARAVAGPGPHSGEMEVDGGVDVDVHVDVDVAAGRAVETRSTEEKQKLLGQYLSNVAELVQDLRESAPFGVTAM